MSWIGSLATALAKVAVKKAISIGGTTTIVSAIDACMSANLEVDMRRAKYTSGRFPYNHQGSLQLSLVSKHVESWPDKCLFYPIADDRG